MEKDVFSSKMIKFLSKIKKMNLLSEECKSKDINTHQSIMLLKIYMEFKDRKVNVSAIGDLLLLAPPTVSILLNTLEKAGYIERTINQESRREIYVSITKKGINYISLIEEGFYKKMSYLKNELGEADSLKLIELLDKVINIVEKGEEK